MTDFRQPEEVVGGTWPQTILAQGNRHRSHPILGTPPGACPLQRCRAAGRVPSLATTTERCPPRSQLPPNVSAVHPQVKVAVATRGRKASCLDASPSLRKRLSVARWGQCGRANTAMNGAAGQVRKRGRYGAFSPDRIAEQERAESNDLILTKSPTHESHVRGKRSKAGMTLPITGDQDTFSKPGGYRRVRGFCGMPFHAGMR